MKRFNKVEIGFFIGLLTSAIAVLLTLYLIKK